MTNPESPAPPRADIGCLPLCPPARPEILQSSPHSVTMDWMRATFTGTPRRKSLFSALEERLADLRQSLIEPTAMLVGGSFLTDKAEPGDIDAMIIYRLKSGAAPDAATQRLMKDKQECLDLRFVPEDAGTMLLVKMACFFHTLYLGIPNGHLSSSFLIDLGIDDKGNL